MKGMKSRSSSLNKLKTILYEMHVDESGKDLKLFLELLTFSQQNVN